jgi:carotenoid 1,2-hydratase
VPPNGYAWWYVDALSDDGHYGVTLIAFVGSVFSPYYLAARRRASARGTCADPAQHVALNVALYGRGCRRWAMTERNATSAARARDWYRIGPSQLRWEADCLEIEVRELGAPIPRPITGKIRLHPHAMPGQAFCLDPDGLHRWQPWAPRATVEVEFTRPALRFRGVGYFDANQGAAPLESAFRRWHWSRASTPATTEICYAVETLTGDCPTLALQTTATGQLQTLPPPAAVAMPRTRWLIERSGRTTAGPLRLLGTLEDTPFYARSMIATQVRGAAALGVHESLDLSRFTNRWVPWLLPFRMPRLAFNR